MTGTGLSARFEGKPLRQPDYSFRDVPKCTRDLTDSDLLHINRREPFVDGMAEMILLCKEVMRRQAEAAELEEEAGKKKKGGKSKSKQQIRPKKRTAKPLSLEYMADRTDVDDPIFGYTIRTSSDANTQPDPTLMPRGSDPTKYRPGMLQGFITVTTFTNWQTTFRWDSMHDSAFSYDDPELAGQRARGERKYDEDGTLAEAMQATVRCGDPWNEGIVWPRIAEISLLGGIGCGKALVSLVIEKLECMGATAEFNYDFAVLQATENSVPFYEAMGFVRVGAILEDEKFQRGDETSNDVSSSKDGGSGDRGSSPSADVTEGGTPVSNPPEEGEGNRQSSSSGLGLVETQPGVFSSPVDLYVVKKQWERIEEIAKKFKVDMYDIIFLNKEIYTDLVPKSWLKKGTRLFIPSDKGRHNAVSHAMRSTELDGKSDAPLWYVAKENDTPKTISKQFQVRTSDLINANRDRLPGLIGTSRLKEGTRVKVSRFDLHDDHHVPYSHWTFPDDTFKDSEPSYMMARKLNRRQGAAARKRPVAKALAVPITEYVHAPSEEDEASEVSGERTAEENPSSKKEKASKKDCEAVLKVPLKPKRPMSAYMMFSSEQRPALKKEKPGFPLKELKTVIANKWKDLPGIEKAKYQEKHEAAKATYQDLLEKYQKDLAEFQEANPDWKDEKDKKNDKSQSLVNKVVKLSHKEERDAEFEYYYVLTFIPDLQWCHLAPLRKAGTWGPEKQWRPIWMLVDEQEGKELDISSTFCEPVKARAANNSVDADEEEWDILESRPNPPVFQATPTFHNPTMLCSYAPKAKPLAPIFANHVNAANMAGSNHHGHKRKRMPGPDGEAFAERPPLVTDSGVKVTIGPAYLQQSPDASHKRQKVYRRDGERPMPPFAGPSTGVPGQYGPPPPRGFGHPPPLQPLQPPHPPPPPGYRPMHGVPGHKPPPGGFRGPPPPPGQWPMRGAPGVPGQYLRLPQQQGHKDSLMGPDEFNSSRRFGSVRTKKGTLADGSIKPMHCPKRGANGLFKKPRGRARLGMDWDAVRGLWVPSAHSALTQGQQNSRLQVGAADQNVFHNNIPSGVGAPEQRVFHYNVPSSVRAPDQKVFHSNIPPSVGAPDQKVFHCNSPSSVEKAVVYEDLPKPGCMCKDMEFYSTVDDETCEEVAAKLACNWKDIANANKDRYGTIKAQSKFEEKTLLKIPSMCEVCGKLESTGKSPLLICDLCRAACHLSCAHDKLSEVPLEWFCRACEEIKDNLACEPAYQFSPGDASHLCPTPQGWSESGIGFDSVSGGWAQCSHASTAPKKQATASRTPNSSKCNRAEPTRKSNKGKTKEQEVFEPGYACKDSVYYCTRDDETCEEVAAKLGCNWRNVAIANKDRYGAIKAKDKFEEGTLLLIPQAHDVAMVQTLCKQRSENSDLQQEKEVFYPGFVCKDKVFYCTIDDETCDEVANKLGCKWQELAKSNKDRYGVIKAQSKFEEGTLLHVCETSDSSKVQSLCKNMDVDEISSQERSKSEKVTSNDACKKRTKSEVAVEPCTTEADDCTEDEGEGKAEEVEEIFYPGFVCADMFYYTTLDNETCAMVADKLGCSWKDLESTNRERLGVRYGVKQKSKFEEGTVLRIPETHDVAKLQALYRYGDGDAKLDYCCACGKLETVDGPPMLLCDGCDAACHLTCTHDKLSKVPEGDWFCKACAKKKKRIK